MHPGTLVIIYATKPVGAIVGTARVADMSCGSPAGMWEQHQRSTGVTRAEYDVYLAGAKIAYLLFLRRVQRLEPLLTLEQIRSATTFQPPQSYRYLSQHMLHNLVNGHPESQSLVGMLQPSNTQLATSVVNARQAASASLPSAATLISAQRDDHVVDSEPTSSDRPARWVGRHLDEGGAYARRDGYFIPPLWLMDEP